MNSDSSSADYGAVTFTYDASDRLIYQREAADGALAPAAADVTAEATRPRPFAFEHDQQKRLFVLKRADGKVEYFRDNPARQLLVEPGPATGEMRPVIRRG